MFPAPKELRIMADYAKGIRNYPKHAMHEMGNLDCYSLLARPLAIFLN